MISTLCILLESKIKLKLRKFFSTQIFSFIFQQLVLDHHLFLDRNMKHILFPIGERKQSLLVSMQNKFALRNMVSIMMLMRLNLFNVIRISKYSARLYLYSIDCIDIFQLLFITFI